MKKEGTGRPQNPDIALDAGMKMRELYFEEVPDPEVRFRGNTTRNSVWGSRRENLPDEVQEGLVYRDAGVRLRIASEVVNSDPVSQNSSDKGRVKTSSEYPVRSSGRKTAEQEPESKEKKEKK